METTTSLRELAQQLVTEVTAENRGECVCGAATQCTATTCAAGHLRVDHVRGNTNAQHAQAGVPASWMIVRHCGCTTSGFGRPTWDNVEEGDRLYVNGRTRWTEVFADDRTD